MNRDNTIVALASGTGGAIALIRISGEQATEIVDKVFKAKKGRVLSEMKGYTMHFGEIVEPLSGDIIDQVIASVFRAPNSYTGENMVEISCHGSNYIKNKIIQLLLDAGAVTAEAGEFTIRAFMNGKLDLSQAEAVADIIASDEKATHTLAMQQIRGAYSNEFTALREGLVELCSLLELELDFGEEDVEFADRTKLSELLDVIQNKISALLESYTLGNSLKQGVPVAIIGRPNAGKSTLLNALVGEERAMVSDIEGTTRDSIEETLNIGGLKYRFIDTAGLRHTEDKLEQMGIERTHKSVEKASLILALHDGTTPINLTLDLLSSLPPLREDQRLALVINKCDLSDDLSDELEGYEVVKISAKQQQGIEKLKQFLAKSINLNPLYSGETIVSNTRHYEALSHAAESLLRAHVALQDNLPADLLSQDIKETLHYLGLITGEITTDDVLGSIFSKFCIGK